MRLLIISILLLSSTALAMRGFQFPVEGAAQRQPVDGELTARVERMYANIVDGEDGEQPGHHQEDEPPLAVDALDYQVTELTNGDLHVQWGRLGNRFYVQYRQDPDRAHTEIYPELGEILNAGVIAGTPYFYFIINTPQGRGLFLFSFEQQFVQLNGVPNGEFDVVWAHAFDINQPRIAIRHNDQVQIFDIVGGQAVPAAVEEQQVVIVEDETQMPTVFQATKVKKKGCGCFAKRKK